MKSDCILDEISLNLKLLALVETYKITLDDGVRDNIVKIIKEHYTV